MTRWEYKVVSPDEETLNRLGAEGWELVAVTPEWIDREGFPSGDRAYLRRPCKDPRNWDGSVSRRISIAQDQGASPTPICPTRIEPAAIPGIDTTTLPRA